MAENPFDRASPEVYRLIFDNPQGQQIIADLERQAGYTTYGRGGLEGDRETCFRAGKRALVDHIKMMMRANSEDMRDE